MLIMSCEEAEIYDRYAQDIAHGLSVVDHESYEVIIDSRRKELLKHWLIDKCGIYLDYGCGDGYFSKFIEKKLGKDVIGVDLSKGMIRHAYNTSKGYQRLSFLIADCHSLPFKKGSFNVIVGMGIFHHLDLSTAISECNRLLNDGGFFVAFEPNSFGLLSSIGRKLFKIKTHTAGERPISPWSFVDELNNKGFRIDNLRFLSFLGFVLPFILASSFGHSIRALKRYAAHLKMTDQFFERIPVMKFLCWLFVVSCVKEGSIPTESRARATFDHLL